jgi:DNA-binding NarL/FixJ family response regulator
MLPELKGPYSPFPPGRHRVLRRAVRAVGQSHTQGPAANESRVLVTSAATGRIGVMVVDGDVLTRDGIRAIVASQSDMHLVAETVDMETAIEQLPALRPDVVFVEAWLASENDGAAVRAMLRSLPTTKIIAFGLGRHEEEIFHALDAGVSGYVIRNSIKTELVVAIDSVRSGRSYIPLQVHRVLRDRQRRPSLTRRERGVLELLAAARSNATIAAVLGISIGTVKLHVKSILAKLGVEDRAEAALVAMERGFARVG